MWAFREHRGKHLVSTCDMCKALRQEPTVVDTASRLISMLTQRSSLANAILRLVACREGIETHASRAMDLPGHSIWGVLVGALRRTTLLGPSRGTREARRGGGPSLGGSVGSAPRIGTDAEGEAVTPVFSYADRPARPDQSHP